MSDDSADDVTARPPAVDALTLLSNLAALFASPAKLQKEIQRYEAASSAAARAETKLEARSAAIQEAEKARAAKLDAREQKLVAEEEKVSVKKAEVDARYEAIDPARRDLELREGQLKNRMMLLANLKQHPLQSPPTFEQLDQEVFGARNVDQSTPDEVSGEFERVEHAAAHLTIRQSRPPRSSASIR